ncbi:hypothetical protein LCGC14_0960730 [marine sediment metagenome]|uniref:Uncharacterized protein n=1 Tax=marine sediment metagenome TaxID=412755 RepID=A0A0F9P0N4_9ZZZZ
MVIEILEYLVWLILGLISLNAGLAIVEFYYRRKRDAALVQKEIISSG